jgi:endonuclease YncB( thermonuclease family)
MKKILCAVFLFSLLSFSVAYGWQGKVVKVLDGDSLRVRRGKETVEVRLYGVDCPEWDQDYGAAAKKFTKARLLHKTVNVVPMDIDHYGRTVAVVSSAGKMINKQLVRTGHAWCYRKYCKEKPLCFELKDLEKKAKKQKRGLWRAKKPVAPWKWRKEKKKGKKRKEK